MPRLSPISTMNGAGKMAPNSSKPIPSVDLKFTEGSISGRGAVLTYARTGTEYYCGSDGVLTTASANAPVFDYNPTTNAMMGIWMDAGSTNLCTDSETLNYPTTSWTGSATQASNSDTNPAGGTGAWTLTSDGTAGRNASIALAAPVANERQTASVFVKQGSGVMRFEVLEGTGGTNHQGYIFVDTSDGSITTETNCIASGVVTYSGTGTTWYRIWLVIEDNGTGNTVSTVRIYPRSTATAGSISVWGVQLEHQPAMTGYIATAGSTAARGHPTLRGIVPTYRSDGPGTVIIDCSLPSWLTDAALFVKDTPTVNSPDYMECAMISSGDSYNEAIRAVVRTNPITERFRYKIANSGVDVNLNSLVAYTWTDFTSKQLFCSWDADSAIFYVDGVLRDSDTITPPSLPSAQLDVGGTWNDTEAFRGHIQRIRYYPFYISSPDKI